MIRSVFLLAITLSLSSCIMSWDHDHQYTRTAFHRADAEQVEVGVTTRDWVHTTLGDPDSQLVREEGGELWKYENRGNRDVRFLLFPLIDVDLETDQRETLFIELDNDVVSDYWIINDEN